MCGVFNLKSQVQVNVVPLFAFLLLYLNRQKQLVLWLGGPFSYSSTFSI